ncbi:hypothetical protein TNCV_2383481 [Trichonephila clavipes]|nr:hypothetical protein TNCV_2383481 [Trichonephila clavipes]
MSDDRRAASPCWAPWWVEAYWNEHENTLMEPISNSPSVEQQIVSKSDIPSHTQRQEFSDSARFFVLKTRTPFPPYHLFLIEKAITSSIGPVKTIRKMRSGDLFLEVASAKQSSALEHSINGPY